MDFSEQDKAVRNIFGMDVDYDAMTHDEKIRVDGIAYGISGAEYNRRDAVPFDALPVIRDKEDMDVWYDGYLEGRKRYLNPLRKKEDDWS